MRDLIILIPAYNEEKSIRNIINKIEKKYDYLVVNDCSTDKTDLYLKNKKFIKNKVRLGYEGTLIKGFQFIKNNYKKKYILTFDADGQHLVADIKKIYNFIKNKNLNLVVGERSKKNRLIENIFSFFFFNKFKVHDPFSGFKIYETLHLNKFTNHLSKKLYLVDIIVKFKSYSLLVKNIKITCKLIKNRKARVGNLFKTNFKIMKIFFHVFIKNNYK
jgi:glycosyltransferase involved in cell wall biosynthesis